MTGSEYVPRGSPIQLVCNATRLRNAPLDVDWYKDGRMVVSDAQSGRLVVSDAQSGRLVVSDAQSGRLVVSDAQSGLIVTKKTESSTLVSVLAVRHSKMTG